jgi:diguanylate cyclase (GGDEF)-like protein
MDTEQLSDVLSEFARTMVTDFAIQGILDHLVKRIVDLMPITAAGVTLIAGSLDPRYVAASNGEALRFEKLQTELREGPCLAAYLTGQPVLVPELRTEKRFPKFAPRAVAAGLEAVFTFPLRHGDSQLGALDLYNGSAGALPTDSMSAAQTLADVAAAYLLNAQARADLQLSSDRASAAALHDPLTGLPNRALMLERLKHAFGRARRTGSICAVFFVDLDNFKAVNDTYGHRAGDELLIAVAGRLIGTLRPGDTVARMSGDEFVILCEDMAGEAQTDAIRARVDAALAVPLVVLGTELRVTASIGVAFTDSGDGAPERLIHDADQAMYRMKHSRDQQRHLADLRGDAHPVAGRSVDRSVRVVPAELVSPRELEVLLMIAEGAGNGEIAARLVIAETTVQSHVQHILRKLGARNRTDAVARYLRG